VSANDRAEVARARRMLDIEARVRIEVREVRSAAEALRRTVQSARGEITQETLTEEVQVAPRAEFTLRVPTSTVYDFVRTLEQIGATRLRQIQARDLGKQYYDSVLRLRNLEITRARLEQILAQARSVNDVLRIESELTRVRGEMERLKGELRYLEDRAAQATVYVTLFTRQQPEAEVVVPRAQFFPGIRVAYLEDLHGDGRTRGYYGGAITVGSRRAGISLAGFRRLGDSGGTLDAFTASLGGRFYSQYLGGEYKRWMSPFLGLSGGYARFEGRDEMLVGGALGLDVFKSEMLRIDLGADVAALFGTKAGAHLAFVPSLGIDIAF
jgi:hypothetical protein